LCQQLSTTAVHSAVFEAQRKLIWDSLLPSEQQTITRMAAVQVVEPNEVDAVVQIFNRLSKETQLYNTTEFAPQFADEERSWINYFEPAIQKPLVKMKQALEKKSSSSLSRRLNRALLVDLFATNMAQLKMDLVPIELWESSDFQPQSLGVSETFMVWMKAGILTGLVFAGPFIFYHLWSFVASGLYPHEQKYVHLFLPISIGLFLAGVLLAFFFVFEPVLGFLFSFNRQMGIAPQMRINDWLGFVMFLPLGFGIAFQLPLVMLFMNRIGLFQVADYLSKWRIAVMIIFVLSMVLTPADPISMLLLAVPLTLLYFLGVAMCQWMPKNQNPFAEPEREYKSS
jgi:sec-independent protein translocase protein TatC